MANEIHDALLVGNSLVSGSPSSSQSIVNKYYVDSNMGALYVDDVRAPSGNTIGNIQYLISNPQNISISNVTTDSANLTVSFRLFLSNTELNPSVSCTTSVSTYTSTDISKVTGREYVGTIDIAISGSELVTLNSSSGLSYDLNIDYQSSGPSIQTLTLDTTLPSGQTEVSEGQTLNISGTVSNRAVDIVIEDAGAASSGNVTLGAQDSAGLGVKTFSGTITVSNRSGSLPVTAHAVNVLGLAGTSVSSAEEVTLDQTFPVISPILLTYPTGQNALSVGQTMTAEATVTGFDTITYITSSDISVDLPNTYNQNKIITYVSGVTVSGIDNYTIVASKISNGAVSTQTAQIEIQTVAPTANITINTGNTVLTVDSGGSSYTVEIQFDQKVSNVSLTPSSGSISSLTEGTGNVWTATLTLAETDIKGQQTLTLSATNQIGLSLSSVTGNSYTVKGFPSKVLTVPPFTREIPIGTAVFDVTKLTVTVLQTGNTLSYSTNLLGSNSYTITDGTSNVTSNGDHLYITDDTLVNSNSSGLLQIQISEAV